MYLTCLRTSFPHSGLRAGISLLALHSGCGFPCWEVPHQVRNEVLKMSDSIRFCQNMNNRKLNCTILYTYTQKPQKAYYKMLYLCNREIKRQK